jgi:hypothetical protein
MTGVTEMTDWKLVEKPADGKPGKVVKGRSYDLTPGKAHVYNEGDVLFEWRQHYLGVDAVQAPGSAWGDLDAADARVPAGKPS